ncbi:CDP-alcohol phosphatidyltransferase family protein [Eggerthellaceae bacterium zg-1084]|uniref:CDP-alcohol phosphatidyltransferase family protein n=1 Tax=Berryella wangjianweii TaxID=2734634 RepID=UPI00155746A2|nr:CDP-alcohol phosphatidyltransferase family protein [Berryella wangjianweii]NPD31426.1 CDP-alcohol phosphatidyltransferase family protein [Berryella wangjianweii]NPD32267.1 CDP-alcohol phosphatidyltransferase family protein [Eggerthellaceae bacterium zg-997]
MTQHEPQGREPKLKLCSDEASDAILTIPNAISFVRLCLVPVFLALLFSGNDLGAAVLFALAAGTDFIDGQIARRTNAVSKLGQVLDPVVDRALMVTAVISLLLVGRLPLWVIVLVLVRDLGLLVAGAWALSRWRVRVPVAFAGKVATTFMFVGFTGLLLNVPQVPGLGLVDIAWLPGFSGEPCSWGIWFIYAGLCISCGVTARYAVEGVRALRAAMAMA